MNDSLGDRMKRYEIVPRLSLTIKTPVIIRLDGKAFHTFTKRFTTPFSEGMRDSMIESARKTASKMQGFKLGFTASDEVSFYMSDFDNLETSPWFGYDVQKIVSIAASYMSVYFSDYIAVDRQDRGYPPVFDGRVFNIPADDVPNYFLWRQKDWIRNSVSAYASMFFSHNQLQGKSTIQRHELLGSIGKSWALDLEQTFKYGTYFKDDGQLLTVKDPNYESLNLLVKEVQLPKQLVPIEPLSPEAIEILSVLGK